MSLSSFRPVLRSATSLPAQPLPLYRHLLRAAAGFNDYNFREYAIRRIREKFREHQSERDESKLRQLYDRAHRDLKMLQRQTLISQLYSAGDTVLSHCPTHHHSSSFPSSFHIRPQAAPGDAFAQWIRSASIRGEDPLVEDARILGTNRADRPTPLEKAQEMEAGESTRLQSGDMKGMHQKSKVDGYES